MRVSTDGKVHRTAEEWSEIFDNFDESRLSRDEFCKREHIQAVSFARWHRKLRGPQRRSRVSTPKTDAKITKESFVELTPPSAAVSLWSLELELPGGCVLRLRS